jgi:hypothetical protein
VSHGESRGGFRAMKVAFWHIWIVPWMLLLGFPGVIGERKMSHKSLFSESRLTVNEL